MKYSVELGIAEAYDSGDVGQWYTLTFPVDVPDAEIEEHTEQELEDYLMNRARLLAEHDLSASDIVIAHYWLYFYEQVTEEPA